MHCSYHNHIENKAFKSGLFVVLLNKFNRVGSIPGNDEGFLWCVSFLVLVLVLFGSYMYYSMNMVDSGEKTKTGELSYTWPGFTPSRLQQAS